MAYAAVITQRLKGPIIKDTNLKAEVVFKGINFPTSMAFLGPNDILVLEKNNGTVYRIVNGVMLKKPLLDVNVATNIERGMLGIAISPKHEKNKPTYVFLYYTESKTKDGEDAGIKKLEPLGNRLYRYDLVDNNTKLVNPKLLFTLPPTPGGFHNGGKIVIGPDNNVYLTTGDVPSHHTYALNYMNGTDPDGKSGILRFTQDGKPVKGILGNKFPLNLYYAYGFANSFGIDFDPLTGNLWDTENGPAYGDEINLVKPGFNSGWTQVAGIWESKKDGFGKIGNIRGKMIHQPDHIVDFGGNGKYSEPEFISNSTMCPSSMKFLNSDKLGEKYKNDVFVGIIKPTYILHFKLNQSRTGLILNGPLSDKIANTPQQLEVAQFGKGFGVITDIQVGPDGYLYVVSINRGTIYRIIPNR